MSSSRSLVSVSKSDKCNIFECILPVVMMPVVCPRSSIGHIVLNCRDTFLRTKPGSYGFSSKNSVFIIFLPSCVSSTVKSKSDTWRFMHKLSPSEQSGVKNDNSGGMTTKLPSFVLQPWAAKTPTNVGFLFFCIVFYYFLWVV
ncbi:putative ORFan [Tupanvirus deep ocean]|uniref:ORFan n=2 Tax=Tupanvirus TaxID=2094720 RepID=A0AC62A6P5_9VIRU|nr:putative ORFan [Tupanvirus deep ocean]QKU33445.1 putative ORFan [Tupanvirus deep ocean]